jgi:hypothetical protein
VSFVVDALGERTLIRELYERLLRFLFASSQVLLAAPSGRACEV